MSITFPKRLSDKLHKRQQEQALRTLTDEKFPVDFSSNDYLGFARSREIFNQTHAFLLESDCLENGATGSRLLSGNHRLYAQTEDFIARFHQAESALVFNSGYDANLGFFSCVPQRSDIILYDELCHASIRDGIGLSLAKSFKFGHNDLEELQGQLEKYASQNVEIYVVTESVFSMDGDCPNLEQLCLLCEKFAAKLILDEAHGLGVFGPNGSGLAQQLDVQDKIFARIMTFGKGLGCHGAAVLGAKQLRDYLINFSRSFIYTTALSPHSVASILMAYRELENQNPAREKLVENIAFFNREKNRLGLKPLFVYSKSAIQSAILPGNEKVRAIAQGFRNQGIDVKAILSPTVSQGQERLRICLHSYNSEAEISRLLQQLTTYVF